MHASKKAPVDLSELQKEYAIVGELGRGGMSVVYLARDRELDREVAIKVIRAKYIEDEETLARFAREARTVAQLQHPHVVTTYGVKRLRDESLAVVMQYVPGRTLKDAVRQVGPFPFEYAEQVLRDIAEALGFAHRRGIVHRDVKPENIYLDEETGHTLLSDFGIASSVNTDTRLTLTGVALGTPAYMSPEQIDGVAVDGRSDLYSLGLVGWEMLTGRAPWDGVGLYSVIYKQKNEDLPPLEVLRPGTPAHLRVAVSVALQKDPALRWANAQELLAHLSAATGAAERPAWSEVLRERSKATATVRTASSAEPEMDAAEDAEDAKTVLYRRRRTRAALLQRAGKHRRGVALAVAAALLFGGGAAFLSGVGQRAWSDTLPTSPTLAASAPTDLDPISAERAALWSASAADNGIKADGPAVDVPLPNSSVGSEDQVRMSRAEEPEQLRRESEVTEAIPTPSNPSRNPPVESAKVEMRRQPAETAQTMTAANLPSALVALALPTAEARVRSLAAVSRERREPAPIVWSQECGTRGSGRDRARAAEGCSPALIVGQSFTLTATLRRLPGDSSEEDDLSWHSSDPSVATVDQNGMVTGVNPGRVTITASSLRMRGAKVITVVAGSPAWDRQR